MGVCAEGDANKNQNPHEKECPCAILRLSVSGQTNIITKLTKTLFFENINFNAFFGEDFFVIFSKVD